MTQDNIDNMWIAPTKAVLGTMRSYFAQRPATTRLCIFITVVCLVGIPLSMLRTGTTLYEVDNKQQQVHDSSPRRQSGTPDTGPGFTVASIPIPPFRECNSTIDCIRIMETNFDVPDVSLKSIGFPIKDKLISLNKSNVQDFVFVTAANSGYFKVVLDAIALVQQHFPERKTIFYDLDVIPKPETKIQVESYCNVEYRTFPFAVFPNHVANLKFYAWKPLVVHMVMKEYSGVFWIDSSIRFLTGNLSKMYDFAIESDGVMLFNPVGMSPFLTTHETMYRYLSTNITRLQKVIQYEANCMMFYRTKAIYNDVISYWVLCALTKNCMAPTTDLMCGEYKGPTVYMNCHRYDQSAINILLDNKFEYNLTRFAKHIGMNNVFRGSSGKENPKICPK